MHPSKTLLLPSLHRHSSHLLRAQIEAQVKELNPKSRSEFLGKQFSATADSIAEKLKFSYKEASILTEWDWNSVQSSLKSWIIFLSGEANFTLGIPDFSLGALLLELGRPVTFTAVTPSTQSELHGHRNEGVFLNGYRIRRTLSKVESQLAIILGPDKYNGEGLGQFKYIRQSGNELEDMTIVLNGRAQKIFGEPRDTTLKVLLEHFIKPT